MLKKLIHLALSAMVRKFNSHFQDKQQEDIFIAPLNYQKSCKICKQ